jgi:hypothetical protein
MELERFNMSNHHATSTGNIPFTAAEETVWAAEQTAYQDAQVELAKTAYQLQRAAEYPSMSDYIDGIVKGDTAQVQAYIDECLAIKAKYPKPV